MGKLDTADELRKQGRYKEAIPLYLEGMREQSTVMHFFALGDCYEHVGDYANAITYYEKGDKVGDRWASDALGQIYENGRGVRKDLGKAVKYYERASVLVPPSKSAIYISMAAPGLKVIMERPSCGIAKITMPRAKRCVGFAIYMAMA